MKLLLKPVTWYYQVTKRVNYMTQFEKCKLYIVNYYLPLFFLKKKVNN